MTAASSSNLVSLSAKDININNINNINSNKTLSPLLHPHALLMNSDVLVRANLAERLAGTAAVAATASLGISSFQQPQLQLQLQPNFTTASNTAMASALQQLQHQHQHQHQHYQDLVNRHLIHLQAQAKVQAQVQAQAVGSAREIIGMGITVPNPPATATATATATLPVTATATATNARLPSLKPLQKPPQAHQVQIKPLLRNRNRNRNQKTNKMMQFGKPLMAPPRLAKAICTPRTSSSSKTHRGNTPFKRPAPLAMAMPSCPVTTGTSTSTGTATKRRKLVPSFSLAPRRVSLNSAVHVSNKILSSDEQDFVEAAQRLHHSPLSPPKKHLMTMALVPQPTMRLPNLQMALKAPPSLTF